MKKTEVIIIPVGSDLITSYINHGRRLLGSDYESISTIVDNLSEIPIYSNAIINRNDSRYESEINR